LDYRASSDEEQHLIDKGFISGFEAIPRSAEASAFVQNSPGSEFGIVLADRCEHAFIGHMRLLLGYDHEDHTDDAQMASSF
jgi:hypothetical protein